MSGARDQIRGHNGGREHTTATNLEAVSGFLGKALERGSRKRKKLWEIESALLCSVVGTCLSAEDVAWLARRLRLSHLDEATGYEVHRYLVREAGRSDPGGRLMHKRMETKYSGTTKRFCRENDAGTLGTLWEAAITEGQVAGAYWALLTHPATDATLKARAFGDVHMLSHINGGENRKLLRDHSQLARRFEELEARLLRNDRLGAERLRARDARIAELEGILVSVRAGVSATAVPFDTAPDVSMPVGTVAGEIATERLARRVEVFRRRIETERYRARTAEAECQRLRDALEVLTGNSAITLDTSASTSAAASAGSDDLGGRSILYVGGRPHVVRHIKAVVESRNGSLLHHDGGMERTNRCLEGLVERADVVVCPIDCVSHDACLRVKGMCKRRCKQFLPLRNAGASSFARALRTLGGDALVMNG